MRKIAVTFATLGMISALAAATPCYASNMHSYISGKGSGTACTLAAPCHFLSDAVTATKAGGEVSCLDGLDNTAGFGGATITQSITIDCAGVPAAVVQITVDGANAVVTLRNLTLTSYGVASFLGSIIGYGVDFKNGAALFIENCVIDDYIGSPGFGIDFAPSSGTAKLYVTDSVVKNSGISNNGGGIYIAPGAGAEADVTIERTRVENNHTGIVAVTSATVRGVVRDSVVSGSAASWGIGVSGSHVSMLVENTTVTGNNSGLVAENNASLLVSRSSIVLNTNGLFSSGGGALNSYKNNNLHSNINSDGVFTGSLIQQ